MLQNKTSADLESKRLVLKKAHQNYREGMRQLGCVLELCRAQYAPEVYDELLRTVNLEQNQAQHLIELHQLRSSLLTLP